MATTTEGEPTPLMRKLAFAVILSSALGTSLIYCVLQPILPILASHFGAAGGDNIAKMAATVPALGMLIGGLVGGWLIALVGKRPIVLTAIVLMGVLGVAEAFIPSAPWFLADRLALGLAASLLGTACITWMAEIYEGKARDKAIGIFKGVATFGAVPLMVLVGFIAAQAGWRAPFWLFAVFAVPVSVLAAFAVKAKAKAVAGEPAAKGVSGGLSAMRHWPIYLLVFGVAILNIMGVVQLPFLLKAQATFGPAVQGMILASNALAMGVGAIFAAPFHTKIGKKSAVISTIVVAAICDVAIGFSPNVVLTIFASILSYLAMGILFVMPLVMLLGRATAQERPVAVGYSTAAGFLGQFANPILLAPIVASNGVSGAYLVVGVIALGLSLIGIFVAKPSPPPTATVTA
jgi:MFS family permease